MTVSAVQVKTLETICNDIRVLTEGNIEYIHFPALKVVTGDTVRVLEALLCPSKHGGYTTRLFLSEPITGRMNNWTAHGILGKTWHTWSWNQVPANLPLLQILSAHLRALR